MKNQENITDRKELKTFFKKGNLPDENAFRKLIDSTFNKADDRLDIDNEDGLMIYPSENEKLLSFFEDKDKEIASWALFISKKETKGISFNKIGSLKEKVDPPTLFLKEEDARVGIGTGNPSQKLEVKGIIASEGRMGNYLKDATVPADGNWHNVFTKEPLNGCNAYEIMAYAEDPDDGKYSLMHAIAVSTFGNSKPKITKTCAHYGKWWNKIDIRWESRPSKIEEKPPGKKGKFFDISGWWKNLKILEHKDALNYNLQLRTKSKYGNENKTVLIDFKVTVLWGPEYTKTNKLSEDQQ